MTVLRRPTLWHQVRSVECRARAERTDRGVWAGCYVNLASTDYLTGVFDVEHAFAEPPIPKPNTADRPGDRLHSTSHGLGATYGTRAASAMKGETLILSGTWTVGDQLGSGGFGKVFIVESQGKEAAAKFVPKEPGADRELLFVGLEGVRNVVPIIDSGEHGDYWVIVMPRAEHSLRDFLSEAAGPLSVDAALPIISDITDALVDLDGKVVHRDLKPENVLLLDGRWCLADFGISRYAEASTAPDTHKYALSPPYAAPERWRSERATISADIYALGVMAYELLQGEPPFAGPTIEDFREQHLHTDAPRLAGVPVPLATLVDECLFKSPDARPSPSNLRVRIDRQQANPASGGLAALQAANMAEVRQRAADEQRRSLALTEDERRTERLQAARASLARISDALQEAIVGAAPAASLRTERDGGWMIRLSQATLAFSGIKERPVSWGGWDSPAFEVVATAEINLRIPANRSEYEGRAHSLWFGDIQEAGQFAWYETAFMISPMIACRGRQDPFALDPGEESAEAVWPGMAEYQVAWPFTRLDADDLTDLIDRWGGWFAAAATGGLNHPSTMPERQAQGSWRR